MKEREKAIATGMTVLLLVLWFGFLVHRSPRFAGSVWGGLLGVTGTLLMLVPLAYLVVKRIKRLKKITTRYVSMRTLLAWHVYAGIVGPILVLLHTGHKFESPLGIALTALTLIVVISGFVGRYLMSQFSSEIREKQAMLTKLQDIYRQTAADLAAQPHAATNLRMFSGMWSRLLASLFVSHTVTETAGSQPSRIKLSKPIRIAESIADVEYAIKTHQQFKTWFSKWLKWHIAISAVLYALLALHVAASVYFGLRWFS